MSEPIQIQRRVIEGKIDGPHLLITGGVHGDEFEPMLAIRRLIRLLAIDGEMYSQLRGRVTLVPVVNEGAFVRGHRTADDQLDLARVCPGSKDGSETMQVAHALSPLIRDADFYVDLHTGGTELGVLPLVGYKMHADPGILAVQRRMANAFNLPVVWGTNPNLDGRTLSVARDAGVPSIYAEYLGSATCDPAGARAYVDGCLNVMAELGMIGPREYESRVQHTVEDDRPGAGHMQVCNPSPMTGYFEPAVKLGDEIKSGEPIGTVCDLLGDRVETITSQQSGIMLVLRTFPRVRKGETVGMILELTANLG